MNQANEPTMNAAIRYNRQQINLAENTLEAGTNEDGTPLTIAQIAAWENRIKFCKAVIKAHTEPQD